MLQSLLKWVTVGAVFAVPVFIPFIVSSSMFFPYITGKNFTFRILMELAFAAWVLLAIIDTKYRPKFSWILAAFGVFLVVVGIADMQGVNGFKSFWSNFERMEGYVTLLHLFMYFLVASTVLTAQKLWNAFWYSSLGISVIIAFIGIKPLLDPATSLASTRIDATFGNSIYLAVYALFHIFIALILMVRWQGNRVHQVLLGFVAFLHVTVMLFTQTRGTVLGFAGGAVITAILIAVLERESKVLRRAALGALALMVVIVGIGYGLRNNEAAQQMRLISRFTQFSLTEGTINARFMNWGMAWEGVKDRPFLGYGQGNYEYVFSKYYNPDMYAQEPWFDRTHNLIFDWLIAAGFVGLFAYLSILGALMIHLWVIDPRERTWSLKSLVSFSAIKALVAKKTDHFSATERALFTGLIAAYTFHNLFVFDNIVSYILFVSVLAYLHGRTSEGHDPLWADKTVSNEMVTSVALPVTIVVAGVFMYYINVPGISTSKTLIQAIIPQRPLANGTIVQNTPENVLAIFKQALDYDQLGRQEVREQLIQTAANMQRAQNVSEDTKKAFRELAVSEMDRELSRNANSARLWLFMGSLNLTLGQLEPAEEAFTTAVNLTPTKQTALFQLAETKLRLGKQDEALEIMKKAFDSAPAYDEARNLYAIALIRSGGDKEAVDLLTERYGTAAVDDNRLFSSWTDAKRYDIAAMILEARVEKNPDDLQSTVSLAAAYKQMGRNEEAVKLLSDLKATHPEHQEQMDAFIKEIRGW